MFGEEHISGIVVRPMSPVEFKIRSKADAKLFLETMVAKGSDIIVKDLNDPRMHFVLYRGKNDASAMIAHERNGKGMFDPDFMHAGEEAVNIVYKNRKSINAKFFNDEE